MELEKKKQKVDKFDELWLPIPMLESENLYEEWQEAYDWVWELIEKVNKKKR
ncbi:MAG: hypothetical protein ACTSYB_04705 [Candidatus Helarchaeota archaeon]